MLYCAFVVCVFVCVCDLFLMRLCVLCVIRCVIVHCFFVVMLLLVIVCCCC